MRGSRPEFVVELAGTGISPAEIPARDLAELLLAASQLVEALSVDSVRVALVAIESGSARYALGAADPALDDSFAETSGRAHDVAQRRGQHAAPQVRHALLRLHNVGAKHGGVRLGMRGAAEVTRPTFTMAPPLELVGNYARMTTVLTGTVVGVQLVRKRYEVTFKPSEGPKIELQASEAVALAAGRLFSRMARAVVRMRFDPSDGREIDHELEQIHPWTRSAVLAVFDEVVKEAESAGVSFDGAAARRALREEDE